MIPQLNDFLFLVTGNTRNWLPPEINVVLICLLVFAGAFFCPRRFSKFQRLTFLRPIESALNRFAQRRLRAILTIGVLALAFNAAISFGGKMPLPAVHDEFSYLLSADTFAHGKLTNPTHPMWRHFESFHIIQQPTYNSKYPPGQGLMLAFGQIFFALPIVGSWLGTACACMAICWALQQWLPARTAFLGGLLAVAHPVIIFWTQSFWGNQFALIGGALAVGALPFFNTENRVIPSRAGWIFGIGCALMLITRPFEGAVLTAFFLLAIAGQLFGKTQKNAGSNGAFWARVRAVAPIAFVLCGTIGFWGFYNFQVTGKATRMPYDVHHQTYGVSPLLIWEKFRPTPIYRHRELRLWHTTEEPPAYLWQRTPEVLWNVSWEKIGRLFYFQFQLLALGAGVLLLPLVYRRDQKLRLLFWITAGFVAVLLFEVWLLPHYASPIVAVAFILSLQGWRRLRIWRWHGRASGLFLARATLLLSFLSVFTSVAQLVRPDSDGLIYASDGLRQFSENRAKIARQLQQQKGRNLVFVRYQTSHKFGNEWIYNAADIDNSEIVWARIMTPPENAQLAKYFRSRNIWRLDADENPPRLTRWNDRAK